MTEVLSLSDNDTLQFLKKLGFERYMVIPLKVTKDLVKFINFIIRDKNEIIIISNKSIIDELRVSLKKESIKSFLLINDKLDDTLVLFYK